MAAAYQSCVVPLILTSLLVQSEPRLNLHTLETIAIYYLGKMNTKGHQGWYLNRQKQAGLLISHHNSFIRYDMDMKTLLLGLIFQAHSGHDAFLKKYYNIIFSKCQRVIPGILITKSDQLPV